jgi:hypothetical protein
MMRRSGFLGLGGKKPHISEGGDWELRSGQSFAARAESDGTYEIEHVKPGDYAIFIDAPGPYRRLSDVHLITVKDDRTLQQDLVLFEEEVALND